MKYYLLAGEASGDLHGAYLMKAIRKHDPEADFRFWGGDRMAAVGGAPVVHYQERAFMGFGEVIMNLGKLLGFIGKAKKDIEAWQPDRLIFIDNSGFNLRIAKWAKAASFNTHYYISPQVWASREGRVKVIKASVDSMYVVLPFVRDFYARHNYPVHYVGHPLLDVIDDFRKGELVTKTLDQQSVPINGRTQVKFSKTAKIIALLPGSRTQEIKIMLPIMLAAAAEFPDHHFVIAQAPAQEVTVYEAIINTVPRLPTRLSMVKDATYPLFDTAYAAMVTSGTATLECGLFGVPQVVCYKGSQLSYQIARWIVKVKYISLVNLVLNRKLVPELIQNELTTAKLQQALAGIVAGPERDKQRAGLKELKQQLGSSGAADRAAALIVKGT